MNIIRRKINRWLIGKQIEQAIKDFEDTLSFIRQTENYYSKCLDYALSKQTHRGLCDYFVHHFPMRSGWIESYLGLKWHRYMFHSSGASTLRAIEKLRCAQFLNWRAIAIHLYQQRIDYLKNNI